MLLSINESTFYSMDGFHPMDIPNPTDVFNPFVKVSMDKEKNSMYYKRKNFKNLTKKGYI